MDKINFISVKKNSLMVSAISQIAIGVDFYLKFTLCFLVFSQKHDHTPVPH